MITILTLSHINLMLISIIELLFIIIEIKIFFRDYDILIYNNSLFILATLSFIITILLTIYIKKYNYEKNMANNQNPPSV